MRYFIIQMQDEYTIYKVDYKLIAAFEKYQENIVANGNSIAEVVIEFDKIKKLEGAVINIRPLTYNSTTITGYDAHLMNQKKNGR